MKQDRKTVIIRVLENTRERLKTKAFNTKPRLTMVDYIEELSKQDLTKK